MEETSFPCRVHAKDDVRQTTANDVLSRDCFRRRRQKSDGACRFAVRQQQREEIAGRRNRRQDRDAAQDDDSRRSSSVVSKHENVRTVFQSSVERSRGRRESSEVAKMECVRDLRSRRRRSAVDQRYSSVYGIHARRRIRGRAV